MTNGNNQCVRIFSIMRKHVNAEHRKILKWFQCNETFKENIEMEAHMLNKSNVFRDGKKYVKCKKCNFKFTSKWH